MLLVNIKFLRQEGLFVKNIKRNNFILIILLLMGLMSLCGCGNEQASNEGTINNIPGEIIIVTDCIGREVQVPAQVDRIVCLYAFSGHVVTMLDKGANIVAVVNGLKRDVLLNEICPAISEASVPSVSGKINIEELIKTKPDLVFINSEIARSEKEIDKLKKSKIPYLVVEFRNIKEQQYAIEMIGRAVGNYDKAKRYNEYYQKCIDHVQNIVANIPMEQRSKLYHAVNEATRTDAKGTLPADWTQIAGAINVSVNEDLKFLDNKYFASLEQIYLWNPEVIIVNEDGVTDYLMTNKQWSNLEAVKNHKVFQLPNGISRWGHPGSLETPLAILWTAKTLYPDKFASLDMVEEIQHFYQEFFNYQVTEGTALKVLRGKGMRRLKTNSNN